jgi:hypothetical protein
MSMIEHRLPRKRGWCSISYTPNQLGMVSLRASRVICFWQAILSAMLFIGMDRIYPESEFNFSLFNYHPPLHTLSPTSHLHMSISTQNFFASTFIRFSHIPRVSDYISMFMRVMHGCFATLWILQHATSRNQERRIRSECFDLGFDKVQKQKSVNY